MISFAKAIVFASVASRFANAAPSAYNYIHPRDDHEVVQYDVYCEEVTQYVAMTTTVYVDMPEATEAPSTTPPQAAEQQENSSPSQAETQVEVQPVEEEKEEAPRTAQMVQKKAVDTSASGGAPIDGEATFYSPGLGSCGFTSTESECVVALSHTVMSKFGANPNSNPMCGQMVPISCGDKSITAKVVDTCPGCANEGDVDLSPSCFEKLGDKDQGRLKVSVTLPSV